jgi:pyridoxine 5-phosphate synthase
VHVREDILHIQESDVEILRKRSQTKLNLEMSINKEIVNIALKVRPHQATLVPEKREEVTTEGGLDVVGNFLKIKKVVNALKEKRVIVSLFIDPELKQIDASCKTGADAIEIHTGRYANAKTKEKQNFELKKISKAATYAHKKNLVVNAGHGLNYKNLKNILKIDFIEELNIGHSIVSRAVFVGLPRAVREMKQIIKETSIVDSP